MPNYNTTLQTNNSSLEEIINKLNNMPDAGEGGLDTSDATASANDILSGKTAYVKGEKITGTIETVAQATPSIKINSFGLITAEATQTAGYVTAGTKSATKQLAFQAAKTITPGTMKQTAIDAGMYAAGAVTVKGDSNLVAANIVSGKSIFGVVGTATAGGGGGNTDAEDSLVTRTVTTYSNDRVTNIGNYAFYGCNSLTIVSFPACKIINSYAFRYCSALTTVSFPVCTTIGSYAFGYCSALTTASFPACTSIDNNAFNSCRSLTTISFPACRSIGNNAFYGCNSLTIASFPACKIINSYAFRYCSKLTTLYLMASTLCTLANSDAFSSAGIAGVRGSIYVPASLLTSYQTATNWVYFSTKFVGV